LLEMFREDPPDQMSGSLSVERAFSDAAMRKPRRQAPMAVMLLLQFNRM